MPPTAVPIRFPAVLAAFLWIAVAAPAWAQLVWTGSGGSTAIGNGGNWAGGVAVLAGGTSASFGSSSTFTTAALNVDAAFRQTGSTPSVVFTRNFTMQSGSGRFSVYGSHSGSQNVLQLNSNAASVTIEPRLQVFSTSPSANPLGNLLVISVNNTTTSGTALNLTGGLTLAPGSSGTSFDIRFGNNVGAGIGAAKARIAGPISGLGAVVNGAATWAGDLIIAGTQALVSSNITMASGAGFGAPRTTARVVLGEAATDAQTWNNVTLNATMHVAIGGSVTINNLSGTAANAKVTGNDVVGATLRVSSGSAGTVVIGGTGAGWNTLDVVKQNAGTLTIGGGHTYVGSTAVDGGTLNLLASAQLATSGIAVRSGGVLANASSFITAPVTVADGGTVTGEGSSGPLSFQTGTASFTFNPATPEVFTAQAVALDPTAEVLLVPSAATVTGATYPVLTNAAGFAGGGVPAQFVAAARGALGLAAGDTQITFTPAAAASLVWSGTNGASPTRWNTATTPNWSNGGASDRFYANDAVTFDDAAATTSVVIDAASVNPGAVTFANSLKAYTFAGGELAAAGSVTKTGTGSVTLATSLRAGDGIAVAGGRLDLNGPANTFGGIALSGGTLTLAAATNTFTSGSIAAAGGQLRFTGTANGAVAAILGQRPVVLGAGVITYSGSATQTNDVQTFSMDTAGGVVEVDAPATTTWRIGGKVSGSGDWTKAGAGVLALGRNADAGPGNDFTGRLTVAAGTLDLRQSDALGASGSFANGTGISDAALLLQNFGQTSGSGLTVDESLSFSGTSSLFTLLQESKTFTNRLTGPLSVTGTLGIASTSGTGLSGAASMTFVIDGPITTGPGTRLELGSVGSTPVVIATRRQPLIINGVISGSGSIATTASGTYTLAAANSFTGGTRLQAGTLVLSHTAALAGSTLDLRASDAGTVVFAAAETTYLVGGLSGDGRLDAAGSAIVVGGNGSSTTFSGTIDNGALRKSGTGTLALSAARAVSGTVAIDGGTLAAAAPEALAAATAAVGAGATLAIAPYRAATIQGLTLDAGGRVDALNGFATVTAGLSAPLLVAEIIEGRGDGSWNGTSGITSSTVQAEVALGMLRSVGWLDNGDGSVSFAYAAPGDTNLDWNVDILDAANFFAGAKYDSGAVANWNEGDFTYDGIVDILDASDFLSTGLFDAGPYNTAPGNAGPLVAVPEPAGVAHTLGLVAVMLIVRRRRGQPVVSRRQEDTR